MSTIYLSLKQRYKLRYEEYVEDYKLYLKLRGFGNHLDDWFFVKRGFLDCWFAPGFHRFWQTWNPGIGYFTYKLYIKLNSRDPGVKRNQNISIILTFLINGLIHNLIAMLLVWDLAFPLPFTFLAFGVFTVIFKELDGKLGFERWPRIFHLAINVGLVILCFDFGFFVNDLIF